MCAGSNPAEGTLDRAKVHSRPWRHRAGNIVFLAAALASLAVFFDRFGRAEVAATVYGASTRQASIGLVPNLGDGIAHVRSVLDEARFEELVAVGAALETAEAVRFARQQIEQIGRDLAPERAAIPTRREQRL